MIIRTDKKLPGHLAGRDKIIPVMPMRSTIIFPGEIGSIQVGRRENLDLIKAISAKDNLLVLAFCPERVTPGGEPKLAEVGVLARVVSIKDALGDSKMVVIEGLHRVSLIKIKKIVPFTRVSVAEFSRPDKDSFDNQKIVSEIMDDVNNLVGLDQRYTNETVFTVDINRSDPDHFADRIGAIIHFDLNDKQEILAAVDLNQRMETISNLLKFEIDKISTTVQIKSRVVESLEKKKRENFLRQQLMEIRRELGEEFVEEDVSRSYHNRIKAEKHLPSDMRARLMSEADRVRQLSSSSAEYGSAKSYLDLMLSLPWGKEKAKTVDMVAVQEEIEKRYYGQDNIKDQVLEYLSVRQSNPNSLDYPILCFGGAVGTGKASLAKGIAASLGRKLVRINGTSLIMVEDIKGSYRSEIGAGPGQLVRAIRREDTFDLVIYLEDLEYVIESEDSNALLALLEAVDPRQNSHFVDNFVGVPLDFSRILFILGLASGDDFPEPFMHRLELVEMPGYIEHEKILIAKKYILPKLYKRHALTRSDLKFSEKALKDIIREYTMEAGLIGFQQQLERIFRKVTRKKVTCTDCSYNITDTNIGKYLGTAPFVPEKAMSKPEIGVANGLAWTGAGGDLMLIEGLKMKGTGQVVCTGSLGDVMKESIQAAHSFVRSRADSLGIDYDDFINYDIHIHFPMGAIPKDGPSAGMTVSVVIASVMAERPVRNDIAMTGEVTLRGKVIPVGGIKEKISAAYRAGLTTIIIPQENKKDTADIPKEIARKTKFIYIESVDELFEHALMGFTPSTFTLEKIFQEEIEKAKKRKKSRAKRKPKAAAMSKAIKTTTKSKSSSKKKTTSKTTIRKKTT